MAFEYGSTDLGIRNPFKIEGSIRATRGLLVCALGLYCLLSVKGLVETSSRLEGWMTLGVGVLLMGNGLTALGWGIFQIMRFFVGRGAPASLAKNIAKSEAHTVEAGVAYDSRKLEQMVQGRKNLTFIEPGAWFSRLIHTLLPKLLFLPYVYRNMVERAFKGLAQTLFAFFCYGLAWFSGATGLSSITKTPILDWLALILTFYLFYVWSGLRKPLNRKLQENTEKTGAGSLILWITASILLPFGLTWIHHKVHSLPVVPFQSGLYIFLISALAIVVIVSVFFLLFHRMKQVDPKTEVSEFRDNWQESIHPQEIFINFESIVMANRRFKEAPNRVYREFDASLIEEGSDGKGRFSGEVIQETQPVFRPVPVAPVFNILRVVITIFGHLLLALAALWLFLAIGDLAALAGVVNWRHAHPLVMTASGGIFITLILWVFGSIFANYANAFWAEMQFESLLVYFHCQGTYTESKLSTGTSIYDSTRSENTVVRSSMTPWILACRVVSGCFTGSGMRNFEFPRHIFEMHRSDRDLDSILTEIKGFLGEREAIAGIGTEKDLSSASIIHQINRQSRLGISDDPDRKAPIQIDEERAMEYIEEGDSDK